MDSLDNSVRTVLKKPKCIVEIKFLKKKCFFLSCWDTCICHGHNVEKENDHHFPTCFVFKSNKC